MQKGRIRNEKRRKGEKERCEERIEKNSVAQIIILFSPGVTTGRMLAVQVVVYRQ